MSKVHPSNMLASGNYLDFTDIPNSIFTLDDIVRPLSRICRFAGQTGDVSYSVAEHSVYVARAVPPKYKLAALFHEAGEGLLGLDMTSPLKTLFPDVVGLEEKLRREVFRRLGLPGDLPQEVKDADLRMCVTEAPVLMPLARDRWWSRKGVEPYDIELQCYPEGAAYQFFIHQIWKERSIIDELLQRKLV